MQCGRGVVEIKCLYSCRNNTFLEVIGDKNFFLELGKYYLKKRCVHYYQVQGQMKFVRLCTATLLRGQKKTTIERFLPDQEFIKSAMEKSTEFFKYAILPELLRKYYTKLPSTTDSVVVEQEKETSAQEARSEHCEIDWFQSDSLKISCILKDKWLCTDRQKKLLSIAKEKGQCINNKYMYTKCNNYFSFNDTNQKVQKIQKN